MSATMTIGTACSATILTACGVTRDMSETIAKQETFDFSVTVKGTDEEYDLILDGRLKGELHPGCLVLSGILSNPYEPMEYNTVEIRSNVDGFLWWEFKVLYSTIAEMSTGIVSIHVILKPIGKC